MEFNGRTVTVFADFGATSREPKELTESWAELQARIQKGDFKGINIGDYKTITLTTGEVVVMEVAGIDTYYGAGDSANGGKTLHHIDFISRDCLATPYKYNETETNNGNQYYKNPFKASDLDYKLQWTSESIHKTLPDGLLDLIAEKYARAEQRYSADGLLEESNGRSYILLGKLWLPSEKEVFGVHTLSDPYNAAGAGNNMQYPIFKDSTKHIVKGKGNGGEPCNWWTANACVGNTFRFVAVNYDAMASYYKATSDAVHIPLCFRIA